MEFLPPDSCHSIFESINFALLNPFFRNTIFSFLAVIGVLPSIAQNAIYYGTLPVVNATVKPDSLWDVNAVAGTILVACDARSENVQEYSFFPIQLFGLGTVSHRINKKLKVAAGYMYQRNYPFKDYYSNENRPIEQLSAAFAIGHLKQFDRFRIEERFIRNGLTDQRTYTTRFRLQAGIQIPLQPSGKFPKRYIRTYVEPCVSTGNFRHYTYSENWMYGGYGFTGGTSDTFEIGYVFLTLQRKAGGFLYLHMIQLTWLPEWKL